MKDEIVCLKGRHDFKAFQSADKKEKNSIREVYNVKLKKYGKVIIFDIEANGFLYKMVRNIAGTLIDIGRGRLPKESMEKILDCKNRSKCGSTAEGKGLFLIKVYY